MKYSLKSVLAIVATATFPLLTIAPASAVDFDRLNFSVDCLVGETGSDDNHTLMPGETLIITLVNCAGFQVEDDDSTGLATLTGGIVLVDNDYEVIPAGPATITILGVAGGNADIDFDPGDLSSDPDFDMDIDIQEAGTVADPESTLLASEELTVALGANEMMVREEMIGDPVGDDGEGDAWLGGFDSCDVEPGLHVYESLDFTVNESGVYDFRAVAVSPLSAQLNWGLDYTPSSDTFLAVYEDFDPANPDDGVVGCNDDADDNGVDYVEAAYNDWDATVTEAGDLMHDRFPWFQSELATGEYTLVLMFYQTAGTEDFNIGEYGETSGSSSETWEPGPQSAVFEMWGPEGGLELGHALADTGVNPAFALWSGLALAGTGVAITVARRRSQRA